MRLVFIDECGDKTKPEYLGFCIATVDSRFYPLLKRQAHAVLKQINWDPKVEFKGSFLFSASKGCVTVSVEDRVKAAGALLDLNVSDKNSRMSFSYGRLDSLNHGDDYLTNLPSLLDHALPRAPKGAGKDLIAITCDERSDVPCTKLHSVLDSVVRQKGYVLLESVVTAKSSYDTIGLMFADVVGYLVARIDNIKVDADLFETLPSVKDLKNGKLKKLRSSTDLIKKVKRLTLYYK